LAIQQIRALQMQVRALHWRQLISSTLEVTLEASSERRNQLVERGQRLVKGDAWSCESNTHNGGTKPNAKKVRNDATHKK
jgi:hypothetical protein